MTIAMRGPLRVIWIVAGASSAIVATYVWVLPAMEMRTALPLLLGVFFSGVLGFRVIGSDAGTLPRVIGAMVTAVAVALLALFVLANTLGT